MIDQYVTSNDDPEENSGGGIKIDSLVLSKIQKLGIFSKEGGPGRPQTYRNGIKFVDGKPERESSDWYHPEYMGGLYPCEEDRALFATPIIREQTIPNPNKPEETLKIAYVVSLTHHKGSNIQRIHYKLLEAIKSREYDIVVAPEYAYHTPQSKQALGKKKRDEYIQELCDANDGDTLVIPGSFIWVDEDNDVHNSSPVIVGKKLKTIHDKMTETDDDKSAVMLIQNRKRSEIGEDGAPKTPTVRLDKEIETIEEQILYHEESDNPLKTILIGRLQETKKSLDKQREMQRKTVGFRPGSDENVCVFKWKGMSVGLEICLDAGRLYKRGERNLDLGILIANNGRNLDLLLDAVKDEGAGLLIDGKYTHSEGAVTKQKGPRNPHIGQDHKTGVSNRGNQSHPWLPKELGGTDDPTYHEEIERHYREVSISMGY